MVALVAAMSTIGASCAQGAKGALDDGVRWASEATGTAQATLQGLVDARPALGEALSSAEAGEISRLIVQQWDSVPVALICDQLSKNPKKPDALVGDLSMAPDAPVPTDVVNAEQILKACAVQQALDGLSQF
jgi:hypothetical protein